MLLTTSVYLKLKLVQNREKFATLPKIEGLDIRKHQYYEIAHVLYIHFTILEESRKCP